MKGWALVLAACVTCVTFTEAGEGKETNYLTRLKPMVLTPGCPDHKEFRVEVWRPGAHTNLMSFHKEDPLVTVHDLNGIPNGPAVLVVTSICEDGDESQPAVFDVVVRRTRPEAPTARPVAVSPEESSAKTLWKIQHDRQREVARRFPAPAPPGAVRIVKEMETPPALPGGSNLVYRSERNELRRSQ